MAGNSRDPGRSVTARALSVLTAFDAGHTRLTLTGIAQRAGIPLATAHRLVGELETWGALHRYSDGRYAIGLRLWEIGRLAPVHVELRRAAFPFMQSLCGATGETVHLAVRNGLEAVCVEDISGRRSAPSGSGTDGRFPLHATGVGKVLLAYAPSSLLHSYFQGELTRYTPYTITEPGRLNRELECVRGRGFALVTEEMTLGRRSVAVPVRDGEGEVIAALGVDARSIRTEPAKLIKPLVPIAEAIGTRLRALESTDCPGKKTPG